MIEKGQFYEDTNTGRFFVVKKVSYEDDDVFVRFLDEPNEPDEPDKDELWTIDQVTEDDRLLTKLEVIKLTLKR